MLPPTHQTDRSPTLSEPTGQDGDARSARPAPDPRDHQRPRGAPCPGLVLRNPRHPSPSRRPPAPPAVDVSPRELSTSLLRSWVQSCAVGTGGASGRPVKPLLLTPRSSMFVSAAKDHRLSISEAPACPLAQPPLFACKPFARFLLCCGFLHPQKTNPPEQACACVLTSGERWLGRHARRWKRTLTTMWRSRNGARCVLRPFQRSVFSSAVMIVWEVVHPG